LISYFAKRGEKIKYYFIAKLNELFSNTYVYEIYSNEKSELSMNYVNNTSNFSGIILEKKFIDYEKNLSRNKKKIQIMAKANKEKLNTSEIFNSYLFKNNDSVIGNNLQQQNKVLYEKLNQRKKTIN
jgi:hypothetical protein